MLTKSRLCSFLATLLITITTQADAGYRHHHANRTLVNLVKETRNDTRMPPCVACSACHGLGEKPLCENARSNKMRASWYGSQFHGRKTASGERFNMHALTAAHKTLPLGTHLRVTNVRTGQSVVVRVNDRGPFVRGRDIDLSKAAAQAINIAGVETVSVTRLN